MGIIDAVGALWDKGGGFLVLLVAIYLLARFVISRGVRSFDEMSAVNTRAMNTIADAVRSSSDAQVAALWSLTERVSRMEGKVEILGGMAAQRVPRDASQRTKAASAVVQMFGEEVTGVQVAPTDDEMRDRRPNTPAEGSLHRAPSTKGA